MAVNMDFRVKNGLAVTTTATVEGTLQSTSTNSGALTVAGGVGIGGNLNVNNSATILSTAFNTGTLAANALYVAGGVGIGKTLLVTGDAIFQSNVTFSGTSTYVYSTNTVYTDNLINIHVPVGSTGTNHTWAVDDGKDVGFIYHYYSGTDKDAFLGLANDSKYLEWYSNGSENGGIFTGTSYGTFKTGSIILTNTTASSSTSTGALTVAGGVGIGGDLRVGGTIFGVANVTGVITTATNIAAGTAGQLVYQSAAGVTSFAGAGTAGQVLVSNGTSQPVYRSNVSLSIVTATSIVVTSTQSSTSSFSSNALYVAGGIGGNSGFNINGDGYLHGDLTIFGSITGTNVTLTTLVATSGTFYGDASGSGALYAGVLGHTPFAQTMAQFTGDLNDYMEINVQNINAGNWASTDIVASADNVTESSAFIDMGITSSGWDGTAPSTFADNLGPNDGYLLVGETDASGAGHLVIGTLATNTNVKIVVAGTNSNYLTALFDTRNTESISTETGSLVVYGGLGVGGNIYIGGSETILGDINIRGGDLTTNQATFNLLNSTATTINFAGSGTAITIGATTGYTAIRNATTITNTANATSTNTGALQVYGGVGVSKDLYVGGTEIIAGDLWVNAGDIYTTATTFNLINTTATTVNFAGSSTAITIGSAAGYAAIRGLTTITNTASVSSTVTGALRVVGGVGIGGGLFVGGVVTATNMFSGGSQVLTTATIGAYGVTTITAGTDTAISTSTGAVTIWNTGTLQSVTNRGASTTNQLSLNNGIILGSTANNPILMNGSYSQQTPSFISAVGTLVGTTTSNNIYAFNYQHNLAPVSTTTIANYYGQLFLPTLSNTATYSSMYGAFARIDMSAAATTGSVGTWIGYTSENPNRNAAANVRFTNHSGFSASDPSAITATNVYGYSSNIALASGVNKWNIYSGGSAPNFFSGSVGINTTAFTSGEKLAVNGGQIISGVFTSTNTTNATSTTTGALQVYGGVGIGGNLYVGGSIVSPGGITGVVSTATNIAGGRPGFIPIQSAIGITAFINTGSVGNVLQMQVGNTATFVSTSTLQVGYSVTATNIAGGLAGQLHYQTAPGVTNFVSTGTAGNVLVSNGSASPTYNNTLTLTGSAISLSTTTGALQVAGGIGVGDSIYVENRVGFVNTSNVSVVYQFYNAATNSLDTVFG